MKHVLGPLLWLAAALSCLADDQADVCTCTEDEENGALCYGQSCLRPPFVRSQTLYLRGTGIVELQRNTFRHLPHLLSLQIENNHRLTKVQNGAFRGLPHLENLSISFNGRLQISASAFVGLRNLTRLRLVKNGIAKIADISPALSPQYLPALLNLDLTENIVTNVGAREFAPMKGSPLKELTLALCQLEYMHDDALSPLTNLHGLYLGHNMLNSTTLTNLVHGLMRNNIPLSILDLQDMSFQRQPPADLMLAVGKTNITHLLLRNNQFPTLPAGSFPEMPNLEYLDLRDVSALFVDDRAFNQSLVPRLQILLLGSNKLTSIGSGILLPQLKSLDLSGNKDDRKIQPDFTVHSGNFVNMLQLSYLNLSMNRLNAITSNMFTGLYNLDEQLNLNDAHISKIENGSFRDLKKLKFLSLAKNQLGDANLTSETFYGLESLEDLLLDHCGLKHLSDDPSVFLYLTSLEYISLSDNYIHTIGESVFTPLTSLRGVDISHNLLESWKDKTLFQENTNLNILLLSQNKLTYLTPAMLQDFSNPFRVEMDGNPFNCYAPLFIDAKIWLMSNNMSLGNITAIVTPVCYSPDAWKNRNVTNFIDLLTYEDIYGDNNKMIISVAVTLGVLFLLFIVLGILAYVYRAYIRYWLFLARMDIHKRGLGRLSKSTKKKKKLEGYSNYQYDAFVSYSNEDRNFVVRLVAMLENYEPYLKLCVYERDFEIGSAISESVLESVAMSRHTLLVVSDAFARSQWCQWEMHLAQHRCIFGDANDTSCLVMVKLGEVASSHMTPTLRYLLRTRIYLQWDSEPRKQRIFWEKLRAALSSSNAAVKTTPQ